MIEVGIFHNGAMDIPRMTTTGHGTNVVNCTLGEGHDSQQRVLVGQVRMGILADQLGYDYFWMTEHHFQPEGIEFSPNPLLAQAAIAARTKSIRLGQAANIITWHHPIRLAEQIAMLDVISGGRVEAGLGRGYQPREAEVFGWPYGSTIQDQERNRSYWEEAYEIILKAWTQESFSHHGEFFSIPPSYTKWHHQQTIDYYSQPGVGRTLEEVLNIRAPDMYSMMGSGVTATTTTLKEISVYPHPVQKPHPQLWFPATSERTIRLAAGLGMNTYFFFEPKSRLKANVDIYFDECEKRGWPDRLNRGPFKYGWDSERRRGMAFGRWVHIAEKGIGDLDRAGRMMEMTWDYYGPFGFNALFCELDEPMDPKRRITTEAALGYEVAIYGSVQEVIEKIMRLKEYLGFEDFHFLAFLELPGFTNEEQEEQAQCFAEEVLPVLRRECGGAPPRTESTVDLDIAAERV
jgi:alkanesulfonate monooxygenase SsuD/methylene tetrahydromethanopterin reductase-like flavin-dependent oxidoreductase (luciferase family)